jgi:hypothetical protein
MRSSLGALFVFKIKNGDCPIRYCGRPEVRARSTSPKYQLPFMRVLGLLSLLQYPITKSCANKPATKILCTQGCIPGSLIMPFWHPCSSVFANCPPRVPWASLIGPPGSYLVFVIRGEGGKASQNGQKALKRFCTKTRLVLKACLLWY